MTGPITRSVTFVLKSSPSNSLIVSMTQAQVDALMATAAQAYAGQDELVTITRPAPAQPVYTSWSNIAYFCVQ